MYEQKGFGQIICLLCAAVLMICSFAKTVSTRVFYMDEGINYENGMPEEIFYHPKKAGTKAFVEKLKSFTVKIDSDSYDYPETVRTISKLRQKLSKRDFNKIADCTFCV